MSEHAEDLINVENAGTLDGLFRKRLQRSPRRVAYRHFDKPSKQWREHTWGQMATEVARWQAALAGEGLKVGDRVALNLRNSPEWVIFEQAALGLGLVVVPLYTDDRPDNVAFILADAAVKLVLLQSSNHWHRMAPAIGEVDALRRVLVLGGGDADEHELLRYTQDWLPAGEHELHTRGADPKDLATIVYTSGTTGRPKGVMLSHYNILSVAHIGLTMISVLPEDVFLSFLPLSHTLERTAGYYLPMMAGSTVAYSRSVPQLGEDLMTVQPSLLIAVPRIFERVNMRIRQQLEKGPYYKRWLFELAVAVGWHRFQYEQGRRPWRPRLLLWPLLQRLVAAPVMAKLGGRLRMVVSGGAALAPEIARTFTGLGLPILQGYGLTETSPQISVNLPSDNDPLSVGVPLRGVEVRIGENDELQVRSPGVMLGYWNNHAATAAMIDRDGWLSTGDQARLADGHIYITGRIKDILVLSNGEKVPPGDMELTIIQDPLFEQVMIVGEGRSYLTALVVLNADMWPGLAQDCGVDPMEPGSLHDRRVTQGVAERIKQLLHDFPSYAKVRRLYLTLEPWTVDNGLLTPTLKVKRNKVLEHYADEVERLYQ